jgi:hypothetical protein
MRRGKSAANRSTDEGGGKALAPSDLRAGERIRTAALPFTRSPICTNMRSTALMSRAIALMALIELGLSDGSSHDSTHDAEQPLTHKRLRCVDLTLSSFTDGFLSQDELARAIRQAGDRAGEPNGCTKRIIQRREAGLPVPPRPLRPGAGIRHRADHSGARWGRSPRRRSATPARRAGRSGGCCPPRAGRCRCRGTGGRRARPRVATPPRPGTAARPGRSAA